MSLNIKQKEALRNIRIGDFYAIDEEGKSLYDSQKEKRLNCDVSKLRQLAMNEIQEMGYKIYRVKPASANCIIRVYREEKKYEYDGILYRFLGVHCFTKGQDGRWYSVGKTGEEFGYDVSKHTIRIWFFQDEYWDASVDFFDTYVKLVKES